MAGISLILQNNPTVTAINCGTSSPKLGGTIDISAFPNLEEFTCIDNDITALSGYADNSNIRTLQLFNNKVTGTLPSLSGMTNLTNFYCSLNLLSGSIPSLSGLTNLEDFYCRSNSFTGSIPSLTGLSRLEFFVCWGNHLTGSIPSLSGLSSLREFSCHRNQLTGSIPSLNGLGSLRGFSCHTQTGATKLTGSIPSLSGNPLLETFWGHANQLTGFDGGSVSNTLGNFQVQTNRLTSTSVNAILSAFVAAGRTTGTPVVNGTCILFLGGTNSRPTGQGITDVTTLTGRGWTVTTGTALL